MYVNNKKYRTVAIKMTPRASTATCEILFRIPYILYTNNDPNAKQFEFGNLYIYIYIANISTSDSPSASASDSLSDSDADSKRRRRNDKGTPSERRRNYKGWRRNREGMVRDGKGMVRDATGMVKNL